MVSKINQLRKLVKKEVTIELGYRVSKMILHKTDKDKVDEDGRELYYGL